MHTHTYTRTHMHTRTDSHMCTHTHAHRHRLSHMRTDSRTQTRTHIHANRHLRTHVCTHTCTQTHAHTHMDTDPHTCTSMPSSGSYLLCPSGHHTQRLHSTLGMEGRRKRGIFPFPTLQGEMDRGKFSKEEHCGLTPQAHPGRRLSATPIPWIHDAECFGGRGEEQLLELLGSPPCLAQNSDCINWKGS